MVRAGNVGFDPVGFSGDANLLQYYREAEMKHARLAMMAAVGWPAAELLDRPIATAVRIWAFSESTAITRVTLDLLLPGWAPCAPGLERRTESSIAQRGPLGGTVGICLCASLVQRQGA